MGLLAANKVGSCITDFFFQRKNFSLDKIHTVVQGGKLVGGHVIPPQVIVGFVGDGPKLFNEGRPDVHRGDLGGPQKRVRLDPRGIAEDAGLLFHKGRRPAMIAPQRLQCLLNVLRQLHSMSSLDRASEDFMFISPLYL
jgi:hypothetical protein